jgi:F0F1-type ATP synthase assembly protein I
MELPFLLVGGALVGGLLGFLLDRWLHTKPILMLILGGLGFIASVRDMLRRLQKNDPDNSGNAGK